jgi:hypothetical protein
MEALQLYERIVACPEGCASTYKGHIVRDEHTNIPRGFFTRAVPGSPVAILLVAQNPGQPMNPRGKSQDERELYRGKTPREAAHAHLSFVQGCFLDGRGKTFHNRLKSWMQELLGGDAAQVFESVVYTNVVKCTTKDNAVPSNGVAIRCVALHLKQEIAFWNPRIIVALGGGAHKLLDLCGIPHERLPHPSHRSGGEYHRPQLEALRRKLENCPEQ